MTTKVEPTVEKWDTTVTAVDPYRYAEIDREAFLNKYGEAGKRFLQREVQEAKAEMVEKIKGHKCPRHQLFCACQMEILASLKQEEEK